MAHLPSSGSCTRSSTIPAISIVRARCSKRSGAISTARWKKNQVEKSSVDRRMHDTCSVVLAQRSAARLLCQKSDPLEARPARSRHSVRSPHQLIRLSGQILRRLHQLITTTRIAQDRRQCSSIAVPIEIELCRASSTKAKQAWRPGITIQTPSRIAGEHVDNVGSLRQP